MPDSTQPLNFINWGTRFFSDLVTNKSVPNPKLLGLVYCLGDDGRQQLAVSIHAFHRHEAWSEFRKNRRSAEKSARKNLNQAIISLRRAAECHRKTLSSVPQLGIYRHLAGETGMHLSCLLETEAGFLNGQAKLARIASRRKRGSLEPKLSLSELRARKQSRDELTMTSKTLVRAAKCYRSLETLPAPANTPILISEMAPHELAGMLDALAGELTGMRRRVGLAFCKKRFGIRYNLAHLVHLQYFIEAYVARAGWRFPRNAARNLSPADIADLLEAGIFASGKSRCVKEEAIGRALFRFRKNERNQRSCQLLRAKAQDDCARVALHPAFQTLPS